jgi:hypothetical protein
MTAPDLREAVRLSDYEWAPDASHLLNNFELGQRLIELGKAKTYKQVAQPRLSWSKWLKPDSWTRTRKPYPLGDCRSRWIEERSPRACSRWCNDAFARGNARGADMPGRMNITFNWGGLRQRTGAKGSFHPRYRPIAERPSLRSPWTAPSVPTTSSRRRVLAYRTARRPRRVRRRGSGPHAEAGQPRRPAPRRAPARGSITTWRRFSAAKDPATFRTPRLQSAQK